MICASCQRDNREDAHFCDSCGASLLRVCPNCSRELRPAASFCDGCGQGLGQAEPAPPPSSTAPLASAEAAGPRASFAGGRYRVERFIGEGAKKRVYLARDTRLDRDVAIALVKTEGLDAETRVRVQREVQAMGRLGDHPHIVTAYDVGEEEGQLYIVSQYMSGGGLDERLQAASEHRLELPEVLRLADEISAALEHAHARGVVHRDLKPGNVWLDADGSARLGDFGLALCAERSRLTQEGMMLGTPTYMPPEQALSGDVDARSDLYAFGALLYEMITGRPPFVGDDAVSVIGQHINTPPVAPSWHRAELPPALETLVLKLLAKDPAERPASAADVRKELAMVSPLAGGEAEGQPTSANPLDRLAQGAFVGREPELAQLRKGIDAAFSGQGRVLLLVGEPGIGKTRTAEEVSTYAALRGAQVLWGRCHEGEGAPSYWPWVQLIRSYVHDSEPSTLLAEMGAGASAIAEVVSDVRERLPGLQPVSPLEPEQARFRLFDSVTRFLANASQRRPLAIVLDDLHWADKPSLLLLQFLARELAGSRILVLGSYRDVELRRTHPLSETLAELARLEGTERVLLRGIANEDVARLIELTTGKAPPAALVAAVHRETEGNPFFVHEIVRLLAAEGRLDQPEEVRSWSLSIPQGIREVIGRRMNGLSEACNRLLTIASVIGREFDLPVLGRVADTSAEETAELLEEATAARAVEALAASMDRYRFSHALVRETLREELGTTRRVRLHRRTVGVLEGHYRDTLERHLAELAYHAVEGAHGGGDIEKAIDYASRAARRASAILAYEDAIPHFERALQVLKLREGGDEPLRCDLLTELGDAQLHALDRDQAARSLAAAVEIARAQGAALRLARAAASLSEASSILGEAVEASVALLEEALAALAERDCEERVRVLVALSQEHYLGHQVGHARELADQAVEAARRLGDDAVLLRALSSAWGTRIGPGSADDLAEIPLEVERLAATTGDRHQQLMALSYLRFPALMRGDREEFERLVREQGRLLAGAQNAVAEYHSRVGSASLALFEARWEEAARLAGEALALGQPALGSFAAQMYGIQMGGVLWARGKDESLLQGLRASASEHAQPAWKCGLAAALARCKQHDEARALLRELCADDLAAVPPDGNWWTALAFLCQACGLLRDRNCAEALHRQLSPYPNHLVNCGISADMAGSTSVHLGTLCSVLERWDEAIAHFEAGIAMLDRFRSPYHMAEARLSYAGLFQDRAQPGDRERALEILNQALDLGRRHDMQGIVTGALEQKLAVQGVDSGELQGSIYAVTSAVQASGPDLSPQAAPDGMVTLMFSDIEGFTPMTERLGDLAAREVVRAHNRIVREQLARHQGHEVELQGDAFLLAFASARRGVHCAIAIQQALAAHNRENQEPIRVRIGLHTGEALRDADKFFGRTVILASRIAARARGAEILVSAALRQRVESSGDLRFGAVRKVELKGISEPQELVEVCWED
jgi:predicted ATPase/class 3 adenylate cyclase